MEISLKDISYEIDNKVILKNISLDIKENELIIIDGESGSGKTTLLNIISGIYKVKGYKAKKLRKKISFFFQEIDYQLSFKNIKNEIFFQNNPERTTKNIKLLNLDKIDLNFSPFIFSEGIKRKIILTSILSSNLEIFLLDEPTTNLDKESIDSLVIIIKDLIKDGKTIIIVSHDNYFTSQLDHRKITLQKEK